MIIRTRVFEMANGRYHSLSDLAGAKKAFPNSRLDELFYFVTGQSSARR
jgi:hypothetical protein